MEQTIKQLEQMLKVRKEQKEIIECAGGTCINCNPDIQALQNAIDGLKRLEKLKRSFIKDMPCFEGTIIENMYNRIEELEKNQCTHNIDNECIRKSVIRDKIEELENDKNKLDKINRTTRLYTPYDSYDLQINVLKEIAEEE